MHPLIPQAVGVVAIILFFSCYQLKNRKSIILCNVASRLLYIVQYILLGAFSGAVLDVLGSLSSLLAARSDKGFIKRHRMAICLSVNVLIVGVGLALAIKSRNPVDILPIVGVLFHTVAFWAKSERVIRRVSLIGSPFWLAYNFISKAYSSAFGDLITIGSLIIAMIRYRKRATEDPKEG